MGVLHDWGCAAHGQLGEHFEKPACPAGCSPAFVQIIFNRSAAIKHNGTKVVDAAHRALAADFGLTNIGSNGGESVMDYIRRGKSFAGDYQPRDDREVSFAPRWSDVPHAAPGWSQTPDARAPVVNPQTTIGAKHQGENAPARSFGLTDEGRLASSDGHVAIPQPVPLIDPKLVYRPKELPEPPP